MIESGTLPESCPSDALAKYWQYRHSLYVYDSVLMYEDRVVMPSALRQTVLENLHSAHQGVNTMELCARTMTFWPGISADIQRTRDSCADCNRSAPSQPQPPSIPAEPPTTPFEKIVADYCEFSRRNFLVVADRLSGWVEIFGANYGSAASGAGGLTHHLRSMFTTCLTPNRE